MGHGHGHRGHGSHESHGHGHGHASHRALGERALLWALGLNGGFLVIEAIAGFWSQSLALLSDAGHMLSDVAALAIALLGARLARRPAAGGYTFGLRRAPVLAALINSVALLLISVWICVAAVQRLRSPTHIHGHVVIWVGIVGLAVNLASAIMLQRSGDKSVNARAAMLHLFADALGSVAAIVAGVCVRYFQWTQADPIASMLIASLTAVATLPLLRQALQIVLQRAPAFLDELRQTLESADGVAAVLDLHVWELDDGAAVVSARLEPEAPALSLSESNALADTLRQLLMKTFNITHVTLEMRCVSSPELPCGAAPVKPL
ncbi:MAG: cation diffusion facilitator family transporter [Polyangiales bacterium]